MGERFSLVLTPEVAALVEETAAATGEEIASLLRKAIRAGLPLVKSGGDVIRLSSDFSGYADALAKHYNRSREAVLLEAVKRGMHAVEAHLLYLTGSELPEEARKILELNPDAEPLRLVVKDATRARGALQIQLADLLAHSEEARERKELIERYNAAARRRYGAHPNMWGRGVDTPTLKLDLAKIEGELAEGKGPDSRTVETLEAIKSYKPQMLPKSIVQLPVTVKPGQPAAPPSKPSNPGKRRAKAKSAK